MFMMMEKILELEGMGNLGLVIVIVMVFYVKMEGVVNGYFGF